MQVRGETLKLKAGSISFCVILILETRSIFIFIFIFMRRCSVPWTCTGPLIVGEPGGRSDAHHGAHQTVVGAVRRVAVRRLVAVRLHVIMHDATKHAAFTVSCAPIRRFGESGALLRIWSAED